MIKKIYHLNCGTLKPIAMNLVCHCLLLETENGLILVDTGIGLHDIEKPKIRLDLPFRLLSKPALKKEETAFYQIKNLGLNTGDVKKIIITHLHPDHIGGISDFPNAEIIVSEIEYQNYFSEKKKKKRQISEKLNWKKIKFSNDFWNGFPMQKIDDDIYLIGLKGHTIGQCGVLIQFDSKQILHCADAYYDRKTLTNKKTPFAFKMMEKMVSEDYDSCLETQKKLSEIYAKNNSSIRFLCSHDCEEFSQ